MSSYLSAVLDGDLEALADTFAQDVILWSDGGGKARAARHPLHGAERVAHFLIGVSRQTPDDAEIQVVRINGEPGFLARSGGLVIALMAFEIRDRQIAGIRAVLNPDKLRALT